jgi:hypothetical protein
VCPEIRVKLRYGGPGDKIILGTTWAVPAKYDHLKPTELPVGHFASLGQIQYDDEKPYTPIPIWSYFDSDKKPNGFGRLRPGRFLPMELRLRMPQERLTDVRAERVQRITEEDCEQEGFAYERHRIKGIVDRWKYGSSKIPDLDGKSRDWFASLWDRLNAPRGYPWASNPWVLAYKWW